MDSFATFVDHKVVLDLRSPYVCLGRLTRVDADYLHLDDADRAAQEASVAAEGRANHARQVADAARQEARDALDQVERERARWVEVAQAIPEPLIVYGPDGLGIFANDAALRVLRQQIRFAQGRDPREYSLDVVGRDAHCKIAREAAMAVGETSGQARKVVSSAGRRRAEEEAPDVAPLVKEADPDIEKLLEEEEEIERRTRQSHETPHFRPGED